jgi:hypothetical protein
VDRDNGMRRISSTTRWLAGAGFALVAAFSGFFAAKASSSSSNTTPSVNTPAATVPTAPPATDPGSGSASPAQTVPTSPPVTYPPQRHTRSGGS